MVQFQSMNFFIGFLQFLLGFSKVPFFCVTLYLVPGMISSRYFIIIIQKVVKVIHLMGE